MPIFGSSRRTGHSLGCLGKLPTYGDFVSVGAEGDEPQSFFNWLNDGLTQGAGAARGGSTTGFLRYAWRAGGAREVLVGVLWPSSDHAGRRFPFTIFTRVPTAVAARMGALLPVVADPVWTHAMGIYADMRRLSTIEEQQQLLLDAKAPTLGDGESAGSALRSRGFTALDDRHLAGSLGLQMYEVLRYASALAAENPLPDFAVRLRLLSAADVAVESACWLKILESRAGVAPPALSVFLHVDPMESFSSAFYFNRETAAADVGFLLAPSLEYPHADSLGFRDTPGDEEQARFRERFLRRSGDMAPVWTTLVDLGSMELAAGAGEAPTGGMAAITSEAAIPPAPPAARAQKKALDDEATMGVEVPPEPDPPPAAPAEAPGWEEEDTTSGENDDPAELLERFRGVLEMPLLPGEVVQARDLRGEGGGDGDAEVLVYEEEGRRRAVLLPAGPGKADYRAMAGNYRLGRALLDRLGRAHRRCEESCTGDLDGAALGRLRDILGAGGGKGPRA